MRVNYRQAFDLAPIGMVISRDRAIADCNAHMAALFATTKQDLVGRSLEVLYPSRRDFERRGERIVLNLDASGRYADDRIMRRSPLSEDGELFWCHVTGRALDPNDPHRSGIWTFEDVAGTRAVPTPYGVNLTRRERQVAAMLISGRTSKAIAEELHVSPRTVEVYRAALLRKHSVTATAELVALLLRT